MKSKNKQVLEDFKAYCLEHPEERFWQALRNWSGASIISYISYDDKKQWWVKDTYYLEGKVK